MVLPPGPVGLKESRVVDDGGQQSREGPEQEGREELGHDGVLRRSSSVSVSSLQDQRPRRSSYVQILHRLGDVELVHGGDDDGRRGEEEEQEEQDAVDDEAADPPGDATQGQMFPAGAKIS